MTTIQLDEDGMISIAVASNSSIIGPLRSHELDEVIKSAEKVAHTLIKSKIEDKSTLVNDSYILRDAIGQVLDFLESIRALKVMINYWNLIFALLGKETVITIEIQKISSKWQSNTLPLVRMLLAKSISRHATNSSLICSEKHRLFE